MKRFILIILALCCTTTFYAQSYVDALNYSSQYYEGTARSAAMGNAFVALGGDIGAMTINPAASAVYRYSEFVITPSVTNTGSTVNYLGSSISDNKTRFGISNIGFVGSFNTGRKNTGLINWSFGLSLNKQNNYTNAMSAIGRTNSSSWLSSLAYNTNGTDALDMDLNDNNNPFFNSNASWNSILGWNCTLLDTLPYTYDQYIAATENLNGYDISVAGDLDQEFYSSTTGNITEAVINIGGNFSNKLFIGASLGIQSIYYKYEERYSEQAVNSSLFNSGFDYFSTAYRYRATGTGINLKAGLIYVPADWIRLGASISTPTWMYLHEEWENYMYANFTDGYNQDILSPLGTYNYRLNTPFRWNIGAALKLGYLGVLSFDYESVNYTQAELKDADYEFGYTYENRDIQQLLTTQNIIRVGAEVNVSPNFALRAGYQSYSSPYREDTSDDTKHIGSFGIGYSIPCGAKDFFVDLTYQQLLKETTEEFTLYSDTDIAAPVGINKINNWKILLSVGFKF